MLLKIYNTMNKFHNLNKVYKNIMQIIICKLFEKEKQCSCLFFLLVLSGFPLVRYKHEMEKSWYKVNNNEKLWKNGLAYTIRAQKYITSNGFLQEVVWWRGEKLFTWKATNLQRWLKIRRKGWSMQRWLA